MTQLLVDYTSMYSLNDCQTYLSSGKIESPPTRIYIQSPTDIAFPHSVWIHTDLVKCLLNDYGQKILKYKETLYTSLPAIIKALDIDSPYNWNFETIKKISKLANFLSCGLRYTCISNIPKFKKQYKDHFKKNVCSYKTTSIQLNKLPLIHPPLLVEDQVQGTYQLKFCVYDQNWHLYEAVIDSLTCSKFANYKAL